MSTINNINSKNILYIVVIRDLVDWCCSMHKKPWHLKKYDNFYNFILFSKVKDIYF